MRGGHRKPGTTRAHAILARTAAAVVVAAIVADTAGLFGDRVPLWAAGAHLATAAIALALLALITGALTRAVGWRRGVAALVGILLLAAARYVRGHPEVRPDLPIFGVEVVAGVALLVLLGLAGVHAVAEGRGDTPRTDRP